MSKGNEFNEASRSANTDPMSERKQELQTDIKIHRKLGSFGSAEKLQGKVDGANDFKDKGPQEFDGFKP